MFCLDTVTYKLKYLDGTIPQAMEQMGFRSMGDNIYTYQPNDFIHIVMGFKMEVSNLEGLNCSFNAKFPCESKKSKKKEATMQFLFFSDGKRTVCLLNNGVRLSEAAFAEIEKSFQFD